MVSALILGLSIAKLISTNGGPFEFKCIVFPLLARGIVVVSTIIGTYAVALWPERLTKGDAFKAMDLSYDLSSNSLSYAFCGASSFLLLFAVASDKIKGSEWEQKCAP
jgi:hypothetical protein